MKTWIGIFLLLVLSACGNSPEKKEVKGTSEMVRYANHFRIIEHEGYQELQIVNPENGSTEKKYGLVKKNQAVVLPSDLVKIEVPLKSIVALSGTHIGMMEKIKIADQISGISSKNYVANKTVLQGCQAGKVIEFGDFGMLNPERVLQTSARLIVYSGSEGEPLANEGKLMKIGILCMPNYDWKENHPLGKAEWIKLFGVLFDKEKEANAYFDQVEKSYNALADEVKGSKNSPSVFSGMVFGDSWYMPAGESYGARLFADAWGDYTARNEKGTGSVSYSFEQVFKSNQHTQFWINVEFPTKKEILLANGKYAYFDAFKKGNIYSYSHATNNFWENSASEPHHILSDLIQIFHEGKVKPSKLYFYRKVTE